ncbi:hypothetical protein HBI56_078490 [Parastagonospora nodorum]|nr:hypothetical protein HBH53_136140 [Parastagonospora nodorum]KAH3984121.1 hypothetical protein HBH52_063870 [Parastagonospora nodorum]KAH3985606.1 hypothetical protein HBH51_022640 [Parastagonospora nodorum]KAH4003493.1 hypothetical protein HBI10_061830 [Parastagonospora nodorum]KAH4028805.1 hypothetical protein HBI13_040560 [Parastagonospora nodorum]
MQSAIRSLKIKQQSRFIRTQSSASYLGEISLASKYGTHDSTCSIKQMEFYAHTLRHIILLYPKVNGRLSYLQACMNYTGVPVVRSFAPWPDAKRLNFAHSRHLVRQLFPLPHARMLSFRR